MKKIRIFILLQFILIPNAYSKDYELPDLILLSIKNNPLIASQEASLSVSGYDKSSAISQFLPSPYVSVDKLSSSKNEVTYKGGSDVKKIGLQQPIWTGGRITSGFDKSVAQEHKSIADLDEAKIQLSNKVVQSYVEWVGSDRKTLAYKKIIDKQARLMDMMKRRVKEGVSPANDLGFAQGRLSQTLSEYESVLSAKEAAYKRLLIQVFSSASPSPSISKSGKSINIKENADKLIDNAFRTHPAIKKGLASIDIADADIRETRSALSPEVFIKVERQYGDLVVSNAPNQDRVFLGLTTRFGAGYSAISNISSKQAKKSSVENDFSATKNAISELIQTDYSSYKASIQRIPHLQNTYQNAVLTSISWERQFLASKKQWLDLLNATREELQAELNLIDALSSEVLLSWRLQLTAYGIDATLNDSHAYKNVFQR
jgi:adhesin transport system outer membrane protein